MKKFLICILVIIIGAGGYFLFIKKSTLPENSVVETPREASVEKGYLLPSDFSQLPQTIIKELNSRNCIIPQPSKILLSPEESDKQYNVISGQFFKSGQTDWAVLCHQNSKTSLLVFGDGSTSHIARVLEEADPGFVEDKLSYGISLSAANKDYIIDHYNRYKESGAPVPPSIDHEGINYIFLGKASIIYYFYNNEWLRLQGAD